MLTWRALLLVYRGLDAEVTVKGRRERFAHRLSEAAVGDGLASFRNLPGLVRDLSAEEAAFEYEVAEPGRSLDSLTLMGPDLYWASPTDTRPELDRLAPPGAYDSVLVLWAQSDPAGGRPVPSGGWGLAIGACEWSNWATYATVANAPPAVWAEPVPGEVWLHEWLHGVCDHFARRGFAMPPQDADGADRHGYRHSPASGWTDYYRDLMRGRVAAGDRLTGITPAAWRSGLPRSGRR